MTGNSAFRYTVNIYKRRKNRKKTRRIEKHPKSFVHRTLVLLICPFDFLSSLKNETKDFPTRKVNLLEFLDKNSTMNISNKFTK
jgi:hypothetical protein